MTKTGRRIVDSAPIGRHLLVTNDFPPKVGGIQNYLWELWRRLPPESFSVYTTPYSGTAAFDARQGFAVERCPEPFLIPYPWLAARIRRLAVCQGQEFIVFDPAVPLGAVAPSVGIPYGVVLHGAEVAIPGRLPGSRAVLSRTLAGANLVLAAGQYSLDEAERCVGRPLPSVVIPPGVDIDRFHPLTAGDPKRQNLRRQFEVNDDEILLAVVTRLVPRKGIDTVMKALAVYGNQRGPDQPRIRLVVGGDGRERQKLVDLASRLRVPAQFLGRVDDQRVVDIYQAADLMAMPCNERWFGLEQEGFGIVFLEAAACGVPAIAGRSGGSHEAVEHGVTGLVVDQPDDVATVANALGRLAEDEELRTKMGLAARQRAVDDFTYDHLAGRLQDALAAVTVED